MAVAALTIPFVVLSAPLSTSAVAGPYEVKKVSDAGAFSLRDAIDQANGNPGADVIFFSTSGTLALATALPEITGGPTMTRLPAPGSPVIDAGNPAIVLYPATDQRGLARIVNIIDMGAVEAVAVLPNTGQMLTPGPPLIAFFLLFSGVAMVVFSRLRMVRAVT